MECFFLSPEELKIGDRKLHSGQMLSSFGIPVKIIPTEIESIALLLTVS